MYPVRLLLRRLSLLLLCLTLPACGPEPAGNGTPEQTSGSTDAPAPEKEPKYLGTFKHTKGNVKGDIFMLDEHTLYIQGFSFDGSAPDAYFWSDGTQIPYYTR